MRSVKRVLTGTMSLLMAVSLTGGGTTAFAAGTTAAETTAAETTAAGTTAAETTAAASSADTSGEKVFRFAIGMDPTTLDPSKGNSVLDNEVQRALTEGLVRTIDGEVTPGCAESWDVSDDQLTYTFHLRDGLKWSDGTDLTAQDFLYGIRRLVDPETASPYGWVASTAGIVNAEACNSGEKELKELGVQAPDDKTVVITLANPTPYFLSLIGSCTEFAAVREDVVKQYGADFAATAAENVYSGPFVLKSSENQIYVFEKNPNYWNPDAVHFDRVEESVVTESATALAMYEAGDLDFVAIPLEQVANYKDSEEYGSYENGNDDFVYINSGSETQPLLQDVNFRKALNYAVDHNSYISLATDDCYRPAMTFVLPEVAGASGGTYGEEYGDTLHAWPADGDPAQAKEYLQKAMDAAGITDPSQITLNFTCTDSQTEKREVEVVQEMWTQNLGINVEIKQITYAEKYSNTYPNHDYEVGEGGWSPDYSDPYTYLELFRGDNPNNYSNYHNDEYDKKLASSVTEKDPVKRMQILAECENILLDDGAMVPLQFRVQDYLLRKNYSGIKFSLGAVNLDWAFGDCTTG